MSTPKLIGIAAVVLVIVFTLIGSCAYSASKDDSPSGVTQTATAGERLLSAEDQIADLSRQVQELERQITTLSTSLGDANATIQRLQEQIQLLQRKVE